MVGAPSTVVQAAQEHRISLVRTRNGASEEWLAEVQGFPQLSARGSSPEEAARRAWEAIEASAEPSATDGPGPTPSHSGKLLVRMPATLHDELARTAEREGVSLNQLITGALASSVAWRSATITDAEAPDGRSLRLTRTVLAANFAVVLLAALVAVALLLTAWLD